MPDDDVAFGQWICRLPRAIGARKTRPGKLPHVVFKITRSFWTKVQHRGVVGVITPRRRGAG